MKTSVLLCTGGIGSGKSFVVKVFNTLGIPSYDSDAAAKELYDRDPRLLSDVAALVGKDIISDGRLDRAALSSRIFADGGLLGGVEALVHPALIRDFEKWKESQSSELVIIESAIMLERPLFAGVADWTLTVSAPLELRIMRVMERDGCAREQVLLRMSRQMDDASREKLSDYVVTNDGKTALLPQIMNVLSNIDKENHGKDRS